MKLRYLLSFIGIAALAAQPPAADDPDMRLRAAQSALLKGDDAEAARLYEGAGERSRDPGLIAFNLASIHFRKGEFREAELQFNCALDDADAPPARRARALYNRAVCRLRRGGLPQYRAAIEGFERCLAAEGVDADLARDAEHNLELAKLLWLEARAKVSAPPRPNEVPPDPPPEPMPPKPQMGIEKLPDQIGTDPNGTPKPGAIDPRTGKPKGENATGTDKTVGGRGNLPVNADWAGWHPQDAAEARDYLRQLGARLAKDRRELLDSTAPPEQPHVKDW